MRSAKSPLFAVFVVVFLVAAGGCSCPSRVPVSLESLNDWFLYHGSDCRHYPYSCPRCPYLDCEQCADDEAYSAEPDDWAPAEPGKSDDEAPSAKPDKT